MFPWPKEYCRSQGAMAHAMETHLNADTMFANRQRTAKGTLRTLLKVHRNREQAVTKQLMYTLYTHDVSFVSFQGPGPSEEQCPKNDRCRFSFWVHPIHGI